MEEILSVIQNFLEIVFFYINPVPIASINVSDLATIGKAAFTLGIGGAVYAVAVKYTGGGWIPVVLAVCVALLGTTMIPEGVIILLILLYCTVTRAVDGLSSGAVLGSWLRKPFDGIYGLTLFAIPNISLFQEIYSIVSIIFGIYGVFRLCGRFPVIQDIPLARFAIGILSVVGIAILPATTAINSFLVLAIYPIFLIIGIISGFSRPNMLSY